MERFQPSSREQHLYFVSIQLVSPANEEVNKAIEEKGARLIYLPP
ncbi:hypothetical protein MYAER_3261 [Microcystis aeruginosa NIES-2549]|uniref:Uncharacterized protein n=1 Tax=Microcystis aeruginosa NIES-2549 TaxID=1641812 RepID=A0A0F6U636_MICAE|nr:hypothetical protein MYAER_3261 [Microcystis aeruginosa NIES-2549]AOC54012.1 hypothetical protein amyaer_3307 [Microcystis aeruginosa NIES-2481]